jgi:hypothetical protein
MPRKRKVVYCDTADEAGSALIKAVRDRDAVSRRNRRRACRSRRSWMAS